MTFTLNAVIFFFFSHYTLGYDDVSSDQVWLPRNQQFRKYSTKSHILIIWALVVTLTLKIGNFFSTWHSGSWCYLTITNLVTKYSLIQKTSSGQTFTDILNLCCDLDLECINPIFPQNTLAYDAVLPNQIWLQRDMQFRRYSENSQIWLYKPLLWPWYWWQ